MKFLKVCALLTLSAAATNCIRKKKSQVNSLENFAAGHVIKLNQCTGSPRDVMRTKDLIAAKSLVQGTNDKALQDAAALSLSAAPASVLDVFVKAGGKVVVANDPALFSACGITDQKREGADVDACYFSIKNPKPAVRIVVKEDLKAIRHSVLRVLAYWFFQNSSQILGETQREHPALATIKLAVTNAFMIDIARSEYFDFAALQDVFGVLDSKEIASKVQSGQKELVSQLTFLRPGETQIDVQTRSKRMQNALSFTTAEAFDSYYCSRFQQMSPTEFKINYIAIAQNAPPAVRFAEFIKAADNSQKIMAAVFPTAYAVFQVFDASLFSGNILPDLKGPTGASLTESDSEDPSPNVADTFRPTSDTSQDSQLCPGGDGVGLNLGGLDFCKRVVENAKEGLRLTAQTGVEYGGNLLAGGAGGLTAVTEVVGRTVLATGQAEAAVAARFLGYDETSKKLIEEAKANAKGAVDFTKIGKNSEDAFNATSKAFDSVKPDFLDPNKTVGGLYRDLTGQTSQIKAVELVVKQIEQSGPGLVNKAREATALQIMQALESTGAKDPLELGYPQLAAITFQSAVGTVGQSTANALTNATGFGVGKVTEFDQKTGMFSVRDSNEKDVEDARDLAAEITGNVALAGISPAAIADVAGSAAKSVRALGVIGSAEKTVATAVRVGDIAAAGKKAGEVAIGASEAANAAKVAEGLLPKIEEAVTGGAVRVPAAAELPEVLAKAGADTKAKLGDLLASPAQAPEDLIKLNGKKIISNSDTHIDLAKTADGIIGLDKNSAKYDSFMAQVKAYRELPPPPNGEKHVLILGGDTVNSVRDGAEMFKDFSPLSQQRVYNNAQKELLESVKGTVGPNVDVYFATGNHGVATSGKGAARAVVPEAQALHDSFLGELKSQGTVAGFTNTPEQLLRVGDGVAYRHYVPTQGPVLNEVLAAQGSPVGKYIPPYEGYAADIKVTISGDQHTAQGAAIRGKSFHNPADDILTVVNPVGADGVMDGIAGKSVIIDPRTQNIVHMSITDGKILYEHPPVHQGVVGRDQFNAFQPVKKKSP